jgi:hypothetical protein
MPLVGTSIVIATARPDRVMDECVAAVARAAARIDEPVELIVVDDRDVAPEARRPSEESVDGLAVRRVWSRDASVSGQADARNLGASVARYDILALTDDDTRPDEHWLERGVSRLRADPSLAGVEGAIKVDLSVPIDPVRSRLVVNERGGACINASMFYRTDAFRAVGGSRLMWHHPPVNYREDTDLAKRVQRDVGPIAFEAGAFVVHPAEAVNFRRLIWLGRCFMADSTLTRLHPGVFPRVHERPFARMRIRLATCLTLALPFAGPRRTRRAAVIALMALTAAVSAHFEFEIWTAGLRRPPWRIALDTARRLPRALVWSIAAGTARFQGEAMVKLGLAELPPDRPGPMHRVDDI